VKFSNGIVFDVKHGKLIIGRSSKSVKYFIATQNTKNGQIKLKSQILQPDGEYSIVFMKSYGRFVIVDNATLNSLYVQMFILGKYDKDLFELIVASPYSRIYKLKK
jgi:dolichyl-diphosphooligosaccharide--protein glycosyltransferase/undecaprenyl-diphosphooligosaccharide--protein glycosyltransferase